MRSVVRARHLAEGLAAIDVHDGGLLPVDFIELELDSQVLISENIEHTGFGAEVGFSATSGPGGSQVVVDRIAVTQPSCGQ